MRILTKYTLKEIFPNYFIGLSFFTLILLINEIFRLVAMVVEKNIPIVRVLGLFIYTLPYILAVTLPIGVLLGTIFAIGRLSSDSEVTAMRSSGVSILQIFFPCYWFGLAVTISTVLFFQFVLPWGNQSYMKMYYQIIRGNPAVNLMQNQVLDVEGLKIMVDSVDVSKQELFKVRIVDRNNNKILFAEWGRFLPRDNENNVFPLQLFFTTTQPYIYYPQEIREAEQQAMGDTNRKKLLETNKKNLETIDFALKDFYRIMLSRQLNANEIQARKSLMERKKYILDEIRRIEESGTQPATGTSPKKNMFEERWDEMSFIYIKDTTPVNPQFSGPQMASITDLLEHMERTKMTIKLMQVRLIHQLVGSHLEEMELNKKIMMNPSDTSLGSQMTTVKNKIARFKTQIDFYYSGGTLDRQIVFQFHNKLSIPFACFFFAMIAAPLGIFSKRSGKGIGIGIALLVLIFYRILMLVGQIAYTKNAMSPIMAAWLPNIFTVIAAIYFTYEKVTGRAIQLHLDWVGEAFEKYQKWWKSKNLTFMQVFYYAFLFPFRLPFKIAKKLTKWYRINRLVARPGLKIRVSFRARFDDIYGEIQYEKHTQEYPNKRFTK